MGYDAVVECCALKPDLEILEDGDAMEIGLEVSACQEVRRLGKDLRAF